MGPVSLWIYIQDYEVQGTFIIMIHDKEIKSYIVFHVQSPHNSRRGEKIRMALLRSVLYRSTHSFSGRLGLLDPVYTNTCEHALITLGHEMHNVISLLTFRMS